MDDGCDLVTMLHSKRSDRIADMFAGTEETTTGVIRLRSMQAEGVLRYPDDRDQRSIDQTPVR